MYQIEKIMRYSIGSPIKRQNYDAIKNAFVLFLDIISRPEILIDLRLVLFVCGSVAYSPHYTLFIFNINQFCLANPHTPL